MAAPTSISVSVDNTEYSRYESDHDTITASVIVQGGAPYTSEEVLVELKKARRSRDAVVATVLLTFVGNGDPQEGTATFYLPDIVDQDLISLVRHGEYFITATSVTDEDVVGTTDDFRLRIVTVDNLKKNYLFGISLAATEVLAPKVQPQTVTGVLISELSPGHSQGFATLQYIYSELDTADATADIGAGVDGTVAVTADTDLAGSDGNGIALSVVVPGGTTPLSATYVGGVLTVSLDVTAGVPNAGANTATLVAAAVSTLDDFTGVASGTGATALTAAEGPTLLTGGLTTFIRQLAWAGGPVVAVTGPGTYILRKGSTGPCVGVAGADEDTYICVTIKSTAALPTANATEDILITKKKLGDDELCRFLDKSVDWIENVVLAGYVEPTNVVTDRDPTTIQFSAGVNAPTPIFTDTDYDAIVSPLTYFVPRSSGQWVNIQTPYPQVLRVDSLFGSIANTRVIDIDLEWIEVTQQGGMLQLVPFNQEIAFDFIGLLWVNAIRGAAELPNFWHFNMIVGLRDTPGEICEMIAKKAAIDALTVAGMALRPGVGSVSLSRDGVSESISYTTTAQYGIYTGTITAYKEWIDDHIKELKGKYRGPTMIVV